MPSFIKQFINGTMELMYPRLKDTPLTEEEQRDNYVGFAVLLFILLLFMALSH